MSRTLLLAALLAGLALICARARAQQSTLRIAVGQTGSAVGPGSAQALSDALAREIEARDDVELARTASAQFVVGGAVVRYERTSRDGRLEIHCEVSLIVTDARGGSIRAMLHGRGGAAGSNDPERLAQDALGAAVRGALRPLASQLSPRLIAAR